MGTLATRFGSRRILLCLVCSLFIGCSKSTKHQAHDGSHDPSQAGLSPVERATEMTDAGTLQAAPTAEETAMDEASEEEPIHPPSPDPDRVLLDAGTGTRPGNPRTISRDVPSDACSMLQKEASEVVRNAAEELAVGCNVTADCTSVVILGQCTGICEEVAILASEQAAFQQASDTANEGPCAEFEEMGCQFPATPKCGLPTDLPLKIECLDERCEASR